jgi:acyl phosphate:glycerol-3-phosphate acyltransferase
MIVCAVSIVCSYLLGSIPVGLILSKLKGRDPRKAGSGNIGATNVMRTAGKTMGIVTLLGDAAKGFIPVLLARWFDMPTECIAAIGLAAFIGHLFPVYLRFRGGKGIATALGIFFALDYRAILIAIIVFVILLLIKGYVSLGSLVGAVLVPPILLLFGAPAAYVVMSVIIAVFTTFKHRDNIRRLRTGTENRMFRRSN